MSLDDGFGVVYVIETAQQFWLELEDILSLPRDASLGYLDSRLRNFVSVGATYHERYLSTPAQLNHSCQLLFDSDFFTFHSGRSCELLLNDAQSSTDPHVLFILYSIFLARGRRHPSFFRSQPRWEPILPLLMDYIILEFNGDASSDFIESRLRFLAIDMLFELCRLQKLSASKLRVFNDNFIDDLFDLVENSRSNEILGYSVIRFLVCLNEQFMVASAQATQKSQASTSRENGSAPSANRVLTVLMRRLNHSKTFGESLIFMLNRADDTPEDMALQLLILKMLYLLFTTSGTKEYFYTNDLQVLVDVFLRELNNLSEENESLKHTYLRVLYPLLNNTQLRQNPYKPGLVHQTLQNFVSHAHIRDIDVTTQRLVDRCLTGDWRKNIILSPPQLSINALPPPDGELQETTDYSEPGVSLSQSMDLSVTSPERRHRTLVRSASAEILRPDSPTETREGMNGNPHFTPLSRAPSIKSKKGHGLTAHMASLHLAPPSVVSETAAALASSDARARLAEDAHLGMVSPAPPSSPLPSRPPSSSSASSRELRSPKEKGSDKGLALPAAQISKSPTHQRISRPIRSRSLEPDHTSSLPISASPPSPTITINTVSSDSTAVSIPPLVSSPPYVSKLGGRRRPPPPPPNDRRKAPLPPPNHGETMHTIAASSDKPLRSSISPPTRSSPLNPNALARLRASKPQRSTS